jgi:hypothetical protein
LRWANSHPLAGFNFDSKMLAQYLAGYADEKAGKIELVFRVRPAVAA